MGEQNIEEYIEGCDEDAAEVRKGPGRPAAERTRVTTVNLCTAMKQLPNKEKVARIQHWLSTVDLGELIENVCAAMLADAKKLRGSSYMRYIPIQFDWSWMAIKSGTGNLFAAHESFMELLDEVPTSLRIQVSLHDRVIWAANILGVHPASVIRMALAGMYLDSGRNLVRHITNGNYLEGASLPNLRVRERKNSVSARANYREALQRQLDQATDSDHRAAIQAKIDAIKV